MSPVFVKIKFQRLQTFLFAVPRLREMVGANVLIGETIRNELVEIAKELTAKDIYNSQFEHPKKMDESNDPLFHLEGKDNVYEDNPRSLFQQGILSRDGGHFHAVFPDHEKANQFMHEVRKCLAKTLPGIRYDISCCCEHGMDEQENNSNTQIQCVVDLPIFQVCTESGIGPASKKFQSLDDPNPSYYSQSSNEKREKYSLFQKRQSKDIIGLIQNKFPLLDERYDPKDFKDLSGDGYLAVIFADGNEIGKRSKKWRKKFKTEYEKFVELPVLNDNPDISLYYEAFSETFYHSMRVRVRCALLEALKDTFENPEIKKKGTHRPFQILMLGGDDLLMVCQAQFALPFIQNYALSLQNKPLSDGYPLTFGAGVAIANYKFPFHRLHKIAEELASSAKRLIRGKNLGEQFSTVDWEVITTSWSDDPIEQRQQDRVVEYRINDNETEQLILTRKPYPVLNQISMQCLLEHAKNLYSTAGDEKEKASRSQLKRLAHELRNGKLWSELLLAEMPESTRKKIKNAGDIWSICGKPNSYLTDIADLVEVAEIERLGKQTGSLVDDE